MAAVLSTVVHAGLDTAGNDSEEVLARDSNAVPSVWWPEQRMLGVLLGCVSFPGLVGDPGRYPLMQRGR